VSAAEPRPSSRLKEILGRVVRRLGSWLPGEPERERARASEARLGFALEAAGMAIWELDPASGTMWWSAEAGRILGEHGEGGQRSPARLAHVVQRVHPEDRANLQGAIAEALARGGAVRAVQVRVVHSDATVRWIELRGQAWSDRRGQGMGLRGTIVDVTDLKRVEAELRRNLDELKVVAGVAECAAEAGDEEELLARVTALIRDSFFPDNCGFLVLDAEADVLRPSPSFHRRRTVGELVAVPLGTGVAGKVAATGDARLLDDTRSDPEYVPREPGMRSQACVPLRVGARVLGVLDAQSTRPAAFSEADVRLLLVVASHVANALERLRSEAALHRSREVYRAYFTGSPLAVFVADTSGRYLEVNGAATALTGYSQSELKGMSIADLLAEDAGGLNERLVSLLALGTGRHEVRIRRKDGQLRHCIVHTAGIGPSQLLGFLLDITDRREAEERLRESEERFRGLSEASIEAILVHDQGRIVDVNHALCALGGYSWHELVGRDAFDLVAPEDREKVYRLLLMEYDQPYEVEGLRRDGSRVPLELRARSFPFRGQMLRVVALRDVSERRRAEAVREGLIRELEAKNAELERFTRTVSHDLRSPLITIRGFAAHLQDDACAGRTDRLEGDAARVAEAAARMQRLLDHLVELAHASRSTGLPASVPLDEVLEEAAALAGSRRPDCGVSVEIAAELPVVRGDRAALVQVFLNLVDNAVKFSRGVASPRVSVLAGPADEGEATVIVRDNGIGLDPAQQERVFGLFEKLDPREEGLGMGLTLVRRIVEAHGGRVWLHSRGAGQGTEAWVRLKVPAEGKWSAEEVPATEGAERPRE
jgi:PAS domain S-box-containing protein